MDNINYDQEILKHSESHLDQYPTECGVDDEGNNLYIGTDKQWKNKAWDERKNMEGDREPTLPEDPMPNDNNAQ